MKDKSAYRVTTRSSFGPTLEFDSLPILGEEPGERGLQGQDLAYDPRWACAVLGRSYLADRGSGVMAGKLGVTDHALCRWLERTGAMDVEAMRAMLAESLERAATAAARLDAAKYLILADGMVFVIQDGVVITTLADEGRHAHVLGRDHA